MGAFGALLIAPWVKADKIIATAPQIKFPNYPVNNKIPIFPESYSEEYKDIISLWNIHGIPNTNIILQSCDKIATNESFRDIEEVAALKNAFPNIVHTIIYDCTGHKGITNALLADVNKYETLFKN